MFVELHMIQSFAPSNLNRDDTGNPKDTEFGGARRARISSQCIKRAIRREPVFAQTTQVPLGTRTRLLARKIADLLTAKGKDSDEAYEVSQAFAAAYSGKMDGERTSVLIYLSQEELDRMAQALLDAWEAALVAARNPKDKKAQKVLDDLVKTLVKETRDRTSAPDIALFGRMLANDPKLSLDAALQVAHAISTHRVNMEIDFFTAVDDLQPREETGAGMMGVIAFNSACFYRYARLDWDQLVANLDGNVELARKTVEGFLRASLRAVPTGKQNSFAAQNPPSLALAVVRSDGMAWSLANAFETPVKPDRDGGYIAPSVQALDVYWGRLTQVYGGDHVTPIALALEPELPLQSLAEAVVPDANTWVRCVLDKLPGA